jgi:glycosyltransferase involved in cell wall biosynthesis
MPPPGLNFIADLHGDGSLSEIARIALDALRTQDYPFSYVELLYPYQMYRTAEVRYPRYENLPTGSRYPLNLLNYNLHIFETLSDEALRAVTQGKYTIGHWVWEMPNVPPSWLPQFKRVDEAWVISTFTQSIFNKLSDLPTTVINPAIQVGDTAGLGRADFGLPEDRYIFLFTFSVGSGDGRKNPWGVIEAFKRAFGTGPRKDGPLLVLKTQHSADYPDLMAALHRGIEEVGGVLLDASYPRPQFNDLLRAADSYVSLHRAEGYGLGMAEAMALGKPVIATGYSGNLDYMTPQNSYLVDYVLRSVQKEDHRYRPELVDLYYEGLEWAEPDVDIAALFMAQLDEHPDTGRARGAFAAAEIARNLSLEAVGARMVARLGDLGG